MTLFLAFVAQYWRVFAVAGLLVLAVASGWRLGSANVRADLAAVEARHAEQVADWHRQRAEAAAAVLERQRTLQTDVDKSREALSHARTLIAEQDARIARLSVDSDGLRVKLRAYSSGASGSDTLAACQRRAGTLADLLTEGAGLLAEGADLLRQAAIAHDGRAAEVAALLAGWPKNAGSVQVH